MVIKTRGFRWIASMMTAVASGVLLPAVAWAHDNPASVAVVDDLARRKMRGGFGVLGFLGTLCCLVVVAAIVLVIVMVSRRRK